MTEKEYRLQCAIAYISALERRARVNNFSTAGDFGIALAALREQAEREKGCGCQCGETDASFCKTCNRIRVEAIREKLERERGCECCINIAKWEAFFGYSFPYVYCTGLINSDRKIKVNACPICSRRLEEKHDG